MIKNKADCKYETPYKGPYEIIQMRNNGIVTVKMGTMLDRLNICQIKPYKFEEYG